MPNNIKSLMQAQILETPTALSDATELSFDSSTSVTQTNAAEGLSSPPTPLPTKTISLKISVDVSAPISYLANIEHNTILVREAAEALANSINGLLTSIDIK